MAPETKFKNPQLARVLMCLRLASTYRSKNGQVGNFAQNQQNVGSSQITMDNILAICMQVQKAVHQIGLKARDLAFVLLHKSCHINVQR